MELVNFKVRDLKKTDAPAAMLLSAEAGWNQSMNDWVFLIDDPRNICMAVLNKDEIIATTTAICYTHQLAWLGMVLVKKVYRGKGLSKVLLNNVLEKLQSFQSIKLDATTQGRELYKKFGFEDEYTVARMVAASVNKINIPGSDATPQQIIPQHIPGIIAMDEVVFGVNRARLIETLIKQNPQKSWVLKRDNNIAGFVLGREGRNFYQIGPLLAIYQADADILTHHALNKLTGESVVIDVPSDKIQFIHSLTSAGFSTQRHFTRMYKPGNPFSGISSNQYAICGPEFG